MPVEVTLPQLGESTFEGTIGKWLKQPGDRVERFEPLVEIITDKVNVEMPAPFGGVLKEILVPEGETKNVGTPIAIMEVEGVEAGGGGAAAGRHPAAPPPPASAAAATAAAPPAVPAAPREAGARLSPLVRRLAEEHGVPLEEGERLTGTGTGGRVTKEDLLKYAEERKAGRVGAPAAAPVAAPAAGDQLMKLTPLRRTIAQRMAQSKREIPHAYGVIEVDMTEVVRWREAQKDEWRRRNGGNLTYTAFFVRAAAAALRALSLLQPPRTPKGNH